MRRTLLLSFAALVAAATALPAQGRGGAPNVDSLRAARWKIENELQSLAVVERKVMIKMRDGIRIQADIYHPKDLSKKYPAIWVRTPYNFNWWDINNGAPRDMTAALTAIKQIGRAHV